MPRMASLPDFPPEVNPSALAELLDELDADVDVLAAVGHSPWDALHEEEWRREGE